MESPVKATFLLATLAASVPFVTAASAGGNAPSQLMPYYPHPGYCEQCFGYWVVSAPQRPVVIARQHSERRQLRTDASEKAPK
jgi:hypothetical protein